MSLLTSTNGPGQYSRENKYLINPTPWNFENNERLKPVPGRPVLPINRCLRALNPTGRAICRLMTQHKWEVPDLAYIFNIPQSSILKAVKNSYDPPDDLSEDYDLVGPEFRQKFPPKPLQRGSVPPTPGPSTAFKREHSVIYILDSDDENDVGSTQHELAGIYRENQMDAKEESLDQLESSDDELQPLNSTSKAPGSVNRTPISLHPNDGQEGPWEASSRVIREVPPAQDRLGPSRIKLTIKLPHRAEPGTTEAQHRSPVSPNTNQGSMSNTRHKRAHDESSVSGPSTSHASASASPFRSKRSRRDESETGSSYRSNPVHGALRLLVPDPPQQSQNTSSAPAVASNIQRSNHSRAPEIPFSPQRTAPLPARVPVTAPSTTALTSTSHSELDVFLQNVMGMDFSVHRELLLAQGLDMARMRTMARWKQESRQRFLLRLLEDGEALLRGKKGLSLFEIMSLESVIGELGM
ncbi:hypothetical protein DFH09DRAFT_1300110 [Mycena vulgaris]|nr:hypothetical protein DFH09DRAFT_1300110 [Mycena vulgaris]